MIKKQVKKLWQGKYVSVRDYEVKRAIKKGGIEIHHGDAMMRLTPNELKDCKYGPKVPSKFKGTYRLTDIKWTPVTEPPAQKSLL